MVDQSIRTRKKIDRRTRQLRDKLWPDAEAKIWHYKTSDGWLNLPRATPIILRVLDALTKGQPVSATYLDLWCRTYNDGFVHASRSREMAFFAGFSGERAHRTWLSRIRKLEELGFIDVKEGPLGPVSYILLIDPYIPLRKLGEAGEIPNQLWNALLARMIEIGAGDLDDLTDDEPATDEPVTEDQDDVEDDQNVSAP